MPKDTQTLADALQQAGTNTAPKTAREDTKIIAAHFDIALHRRLKFLAYDEGRSLQSLLAAA